jgi:hypothetical protein
MFSPVARPLPTQDNKTTEEMWTGINASSGIRTAIPVFKCAKAFHASYRKTTVIDPYVFSIHNHLPVLCNEDNNPVFEMNFLMLFLRGKKCLFGENCHAIYGVRT